MDGNDDTSARIQRSKEEINRAYASKKQEMDAQIDEFLDKPKRMANGNGSSSSSKGGRSVVGTGSTGGTGGSSNTRTAAMSPIGSPGGGGNLGSNSPLPAGRDNNTSRNSNNSSISDPKSFEEVYQLSMRNKQRNKDKRRAGDGGGASATQGEEDEDSDAEVTGSDNNNQKEEPVAMDVDAGNSSEGDADDVDVPSTKTGGSAATKRGSKSKKNATTVNPEQYFNNAANADLGMDDPEGGLDSTVSGCTFCFILFVFLLFVQTNFLFNSLCVCLLFFSRNYIWFFSLTSRSLWGGCPAKSSAPS
jgi:hypothetical protein